MLTTDADFNAAAEVMRRGMLNKTGVWLCGAFTGTFPSTASGFQT
jgi:hypothetical protein